MIAYDAVAQDQHRRDDAVLLEENRLWAATRAARYQQALNRYHSRKVHAWCLEEGDRTVNYQVLEMIGVLFRSTRQDHH